MTETESTSETSVNFYQTTRRNIAEDAWRSGGIFPSILNLDTRWKRIVIFTLWLPYLQGRGPPVATGQKAGWYKTHSSNNDVWRTLNGEHLTTWVLATQQLTDLDSWTSRWDFRFWRRRVTHSWFIIHQGQVCLCLHISNSITRYNHKTYITCTQVLHYAFALVLWRQ
jgi:hypothetical protein